MPTYLYKCRSCNYEFERFSSISSYSKELACPVCGKVAEITISGGSGLIFKGSGFYITDYKNNKGNATPKKENKPPDDSK
ncbi:MAG: zinc ribbon domain-containing protein [Calditrichia bacterium]